MLIPDAAPLGDPYIFLYYWQKIYDGTKLENDGGCEG